MGLIRIQTDKAEAGIHAERFFVMWALWERKCKEWQPEGKGEEGGGVEGWVGKEGGGVNVGCKDAVGLIVHRYLACVCKSDLSQRCILCVCVSVRVCMRVHVRMCAYARHYYPAVTGPLLCLQKDGRPLSLAS